MHIRKAIFLSSQDAALYKTRRHPGYREKHDYRIRVQAIEPEANLKLAIYRDDDQHQNDPPHFEQEFTDLNALEEYLSEWRLDIENLWTPDEPEEPKHE